MLNVVEIAQRTAMGRKIDICEPGGKGTVLLIEAKTEDGHKACHAIWVSNEDIKDPKYQPILEQEIQKRLREEPLEKLDAKPKTKSGR